MKRAGTKRRSGPAPQRKWKPVAKPPEPYDIVLLAFADGTTGRGTWNGRMWWGYDQRTRKSRALHPTAWYPLE